MQILFPIERTKELSFQPFYIFSWNSTRLRARQKERLAKRNAKETSAPVEGSTGTQYFAQLLQSQAQDGNQSALFIQPSEENSSALFLDGSSSGQTSEGRKNRTDSTVRLVKLPKHLGQPNLGEGPSYMNSEAENPLVIGLCAPNANPMESSQRKFSRSYNRKNRLGLGPDLPPSIAPCPTTSDEMGTKAHETISGRFKLPDPPLDVSQSRPKISIPDLYHPFNPVCSLLSLTQFAICLVGHIFVCLCCTVLFAASSHFPARQRFYC